MAINHDDFWRVGAVRIRASAPDPFAGLRGRAYIAARKLDQTPVQKIENPADAQAKSESRVNLVNAITQRPADADRKLKQLTQFEEAEAMHAKSIVFASGSMNFLNESGDRRFWPVDLPKVSRKLRRAK